MDILDILDLRLVTIIMADPQPSQTQNDLPILADDQLRDRVRQFVEFLDDEVGPHGFRTTAGLYLPRRWMVWQ